MCENSKRYCGDIELPDCHKGDKVQGYHLMGMNSTGVGSAIQSHEKGKQNHDIGS
jgi:hypothetical protein